MAPIHAFKHSNLRNVIFGLVIVVSACKTKKMPESVYGEITLAGLKSDPVCDWIAEEGNTPEPAVMAALHKINWSDCNWKVYLGCWCSDSKKLVPEFLKLKKELNWPDSSIRYYSLDLDKHSPAGTEAGDSVIYLPTFILYRKGHEMGRVVETASPDLGTAILALF